MIFLVAITMFVLALVHLERNHFFLGTIMIVSSLIHLSTFSLGGGFKNKLKLIDFTFFVATIGVAILFFVADPISVHTKCIIWGAFDIARNIAHLVSSSIEVRENKLEIMEMVAAINEIVFSILLIFEQMEGVTTHLIVMGCAYTTFASKFLIDYLQERKQKE